MFTSGTALISICIIGLAAFTYFLDQSLSSKVFSLSYGQSAAHSGHSSEDRTNTTSKYSGQEQNRTIKSLSSEDILSLQTGTGDAFGGIALLAELNGYPGPRHILDLANELGLSTEQKQNVTTIYNNMKNQAIKLGNEIISLEKTANDAFANKSITDSQLKQLIFESAQRYGQLRYVHLSTHLSMQNILTPEQISLYNQLRGYSQ